MQLHAFRELSATKSDDPFCINLEEDADIHACREVATAKLLRYRIHVQFNAKNPSRVRLDTFAKDIIIGQSSCQGQSMST